MRRKGLAVTIGLGMQVRVACSVVLALVVAWSGCSTDSGVPAAPGRGGSSGDGGTNAAGQAGSGGAGGVVTGGSGGLATGGASAGGSGGSSTGGSATGGTAGTGGSAPIDASYPDVVFTYDGAGGTGPVTQDSACASVSETATVERQPADILFVVDNSGSMGAEVGFVRQNMNTFSQQIINSGIDVHVVLITAPSTQSNGICIAAPLGSGNCPADTNLPRYLHVELNVGSNNPLDLVLSSYGQWQSAMRPTAPKHVVVVTDDNSSLAAASFDTQFKALHASHAGYKFHGIFSYEDPFSSCIALPPRPCCGQSAAAGTVYRELVTLTRGVQGDLCLQNFAPVFNALASSVISGTPIKCEFPMPRPQTGVVNPEQVTLEFQATPTSPKQTWTKVSGAGACTATGFYYDTTPNPTKIILCPQACATAQQSSNPTINVLLGCLGS